MTCDKCGTELQVGSFPFCKGNASDHSPGRYGVQGDEIDITTKHIDGVERRFRSRSELNATLKAHGLENRVYHVPFNRDSDKSPYTTRWH